MVTTETNLRLDDLDKDSGLEITVGRKKYRIKHLKNSVAERLDRYIAKGEVEYSDDKGVLLANMSKNRKLVPKCLSLMILGSFFKVMFFHWIYWRYLHIFKSQAEMQKVLEPAFEMNDVGFFFQNMVSLQANSRMIQKMAKTSTITIARKQDSAPEIASS